MRLFIACSCIFVALTFSATLSAQTPASQPNIVFFLVDDLGRSDVGFMGCKDIQTPNIDRLAKSGSILDAHYVQPVCSPTRAALMTGRYATRTGVYTVVRPNAKWGLPLDERTLPQALHEAGYQTAICGKWHLGEFQDAFKPTRRGFDLQYGHYFGALDYFTHFRDGQKDWYRNDQPVEEEGYSTHLLAREASKIIRERNPKKPLFLYVPFNGVHAPLQVPNRYTQPYANIEGNRRTYAGMLAAVDEAIGQIVQTLEDAKMRENTLIIFSSDNGGPNPGKLTSNIPLRAGKGTIYEGGIRVCAFASYPGKIPSGETIREPMHAIDWFPTLVQLAGGKLEQKLPIDGKDVWPMLTQHAKTPHESLLLVQTPERAAVRQGDWKLMQLGATLNDDGEYDEATSPRAKNSAKSDAKFELYNLANDVSESTNLLEKESARAEAMKKVLQEYLRDAVEPGSRKGRR